MTSLPIDSIQQQFQSALKTDHLIVEAETGSGKSTRLPLWAMESGRVLVIEPRRIACTSLASHLAQTLNEQEGETIGYAIKLASCFTERTKVVFATPGVALRWFEQDRLAQFSTIIVDEFHERRWDTDLLVAMLKHHQKHRVVITSATIEGEKLARYFDAKRLTAQGRNYEVTIEYAAKDSSHLPDARHLDTRIAEQVLEQLDKQQGDILVFVPGRKEIQQAMQILRAKLDHVLVVPLHASVTDAERNLALSQQSQQKIVLATNVAETSLTIPNISLVIDSGLERRNQQRNGRTTLMLSHISQSSAKQRAGRAGRVMHGRCIRLYGQHAALIKTTPPELQREALTEPMLAAASCHYSLPQLRFLDPLPQKTLDSANKQLLDLGALDEQGVITEHGRRLAPLPVDILYADLVNKMASKATQEACIDLVAALSVAGRLYQVSNNEQQREQLAKQEPFGCDVQLLISLVRGREFTGVTLDKERCLEAQGLSEQMRELYQLPRLEVASRYQREALIEQIVLANATLLFVRREKRQDAMSNGQIEALLPRETRIPADFEAALVLDTHSLPGRGVKQTLTLATVMMPVSFKQVAALNLGQWQADGLLDTEHGMVSQEKLVYAGRTIATRQGELATEHICGVIADQICAGERYPELAQAMYQKQYHWQLYQTLSSPSFQMQDIDLKAWFEKQLNDLGVTQWDDLELIEAEDFSFEGIPDWEYDDFAQRFPLKVILSGLTLSVEYLAKAKLVKLTYESGARKEDPKRKELPVWSGWRIKYQKASRVIDIK
ncbi:helicase-related protein [Vibrio hippocampi]|uniref:ATP-dependent RNA helicase SrmB n=1 Tax=Vibrio hippocampi TaxID=654686 RepID=A0ABM8ZH12_9VIBR|nr:helicase-related protein [Vibrio hippocampi]CAH0525816.1 ATP-dependent RNA helicase SrmB [Vibrio hippocampi]